MKVNKSLSKFIALVLSVALVLTMRPVAVSAETEGCTHAHNTECGYAEGVACRHTQHDESCGCAEAVSCGSCTHTQHDEACGYIEAVPCDHMHDETCGGLIDSGKTPGESGDTVRIAAFDKLGGEILRQDFDLGEIQSQDDITLPDTLTGTDTDDNTVIIDGVTWQSDPEFDPEAAGRYRFSPKLPEEYELAAGATPPAITVTLGTRTQETPIIITAFGDLDDDISGQSYDLGTVTSIDDLILPDTLKGSDQDGGEITIGGVTWECEAGFDPVVAGGYLFSAALPEEYMLAEGLSAPFIFVFIRPEGEAEKSTYSNGSVEIVAEDDAESLHVKFIDAFNDAGSDDTITVTGEKTNVNFNFPLTIPAGVTVDWQATYTAPAAFGASLITLFGTGTLKVTDGKISAVNYDTIQINDTIAVVVTGGEVSTATGMAIFINSSGSVAVSKTGAVKATGDDSTAIYAAGNAAINVTGGTVSASGSGNADNAIEANGTGSTVDIKGGAVSATAGNAIYSLGTVNISDDADVSATTGKALYAGVGSTVVNIAGGTVSATGSSGLAIDTGIGSSVTVSGDAAVSSNNGAAINASRSTVEISGSATVKAEGTSQDAIQARNSAVVIVKESAEITGARYGINLNATSAAAVLQGGEVSGSPNAVYNSGTVYYIGNTTVTNNISGGTVYYLNSANANKFTNGTATQLDAAPTPQTATGGMAVMLPDVLDYNTITVNNALGVVNTTAGTVTFTTPGTYDNVTLGVKATVPNTDFTFPFTTESFNVIVATKTWVTIDGISIANKTYDGAQHGGYSGDADAAYITTPDGQSVSPTGSLAATYTGLDTTYGPTNTPPTNAGTYKVTVTLIDDTYYGTREYHFIVNPKLIDITGVTAVNREYNGTTAVTLAGSGTLDGVLYEDMGKVGFDLSGGGTLANKNAGRQYITTKITLTGSQAGNYILKPPTGLIVSITPIELTNITFTPANKEYDGTTTATVPDINMEAANGILDSDTVTVQITAASFNDKNVSNSKTVMINAWQLNGSDAGNYILPAAKPTATANIAAKELTIDGFTITKVYNGSNTVTGGFGTLTFTGLITGETANVNTSGITAAYDNANVGTNKEITFTGDFSMSGSTASMSNYTITQPTGVTGTITAKQLTDSMIVVNGGPFTYTGSVQTPAITVTDGGTTLVLSTDYENVNHSNNTNVGTASVSITGKGNYTGTATGSFTIVKATPALLTWPAASDLTYGAALSASTLTGGSATGTWAWTDETIIPTVSNSGYEVTFTPNDTAHYDWSNVTVKQTVSITVNKAPAPDITWPTANGVTYGQTLSDSALSFTSNNYGTFEWTDPLISPVRNNSGYSVTFIPFNDTIANYNTIATTTQNVAVDVAAKNVSSLTIEPITAVTYDGTSHEPIPDQDIIVKDGNTTLTSVTDYTVTYSNNIFAGTATVTITGTGNYTGTKEAEFTIYKAAPAQLTWPEASDLTYGEALSMSNLTDGSTTGTWAWTDSSIIPTVINSGYNVTFTPADTANYDWSGVVLTQAVNIQVSKAGGLTVSTEPAMNAREGIGPARNYSFDMNNITLNKGDTGVKTYSAVKDTDGNNILSNIAVTNNILTYDIAGTADVGDTATIAITIESDNYTNITAMLTITVTVKDTQTIRFEEAASTKTYGDAKFTAAAILDGSGGTGAVTYTSDNTSVATVNAATGEVTIMGAGSANITAIKAEDADWFGATASYTLTVIKASQNAPKGIGKTDETNPGANNGTMTGVTTTMEYRCSTETVYTPIPGTTVSGLSLGTYYIRYAATANHNPSPDTAITIAAYIAPVTETPSSDSKDSIVENNYYGTTPEAPKFWGAVNTDIAEEISNTEGSNHNIVTGRNIVVPAFILETLQDSSTTLAMHTGMGVTFSITGSDIPDRTDTDTTVNLTVRQGGLTAPEELIKEKTKDTIHSIEIPMESHESFGMTVNVHFSLGAENADNYANLYRYNEQTGAFEYLGSYQINEDGQAMFGITGGADFLLTVTAEKPDEVIMPMSGETYTVKPGDTLSGTAAKYGVSVAQIMALNPDIKNSSRIRTGQKIRVR